MSNTEIFVLEHSYINSTQVYFNWYLSIYSPSDTIETDTFYLAYTNEFTSQTITVNTGNLMNHTLELSPETEYTVVVYSINESLEQSQDSNVVAIKTGDLYANYYGTNWSLRPFDADVFNVVTVEDLEGVVTVSSASSVVPQSTFVDIITSSSPKPFYQLYKIDPNGSLFGKTPCGYFNFKHRTITL